MINNALLILIKPPVSLSRYQASASQKVGDDRLNINTNMQFILAPFLSWRREKKK